MEPIIKEVSIHAPASTVWKAITDKEEMKNWYFDIPGFEPVAGNNTSFYAECDGQQYLHIWQVKEVVPQKKISYSWRYEQTKGSSLVTFELFEKGDVTIVRLTHEGIELFADNGASFTRESFDEGWTEFIESALKKYAEQVTI